MAGVDVDNEALPAEAIAALQHESENLVGVDIEHYVRALRADRHPRRRRLSTE